MRPFACHTPAATFTALLWAGLILPWAPLASQVHPSPDFREAEEGTLQVSGQAQVQVPADRTLISFAVETEAPSAEEASRENAGKMAAVFQALEALEVEGLQLETHGYSLSPQYRRPTPQDEPVPVIAGYRVTNQIRATFHGTGDAGEVLDAGIGAGANRVVNLAFQASDTREARLRALEMAVVSAREEARTMATAMDLVLGPPLEIRGGASQEGPRPVAVAYRAAEAVSAPTPIEAGGQTVTATVTITYRVMEKTP